MTNEKERKLKLIWDFKGPDSARIAEHHAKHLGEYVKSKKLSLTTGSEEINPEHHIAFLLVDESEMPPLRDSLKPHRGQVYSTE